MQWGVCRSGFWRRLTGLLVVGLILVFVSVGYFAASRWGHTDGDGLSNTLNNSPKPSVTAPTPTPRPAPAPAPAPAPESEPAPTPEEVLFADCNRGLRASCRAYADIMLNGGSGTGRNPQAAVDALDQVCRLQPPDNVACYKLGDLYEKGDTGVPRDDLKAAEAFRRGWDNRGKSCGIRLGKLHLKEGSTAWNPPEGRATLKSACDMGEAVACFELSRVYDRGIGISPNIDTAKKYHREGCKLQPSLCD